MVTTVSAKTLGSNFMAFSSKAFDLVEERYLQVKREKAVVYNLEGGSSQVNWDKLCPNFEARVATMNCSALESVMYTAGDFTCILQ
jgi:hypothetical protein